MRLTSWIPGRQTAGVTPLRRLTPMLCWIAGLAAVGALMLVVGRGTLAGPDLATPSTWGDWAAARPAPDAAVAVLRLVVLALDAYLLGATVIAVGLRVARAERAITVADVLTVPAVLRVVQAGLGVGIVGASIAAAASGSTGVPSPPTHADVALVSADDEPPTIRELPEKATPKSTTTTTAVPTTTTTMPATASAPALVVPEPVIESSTWVVQPGDHFWSIAERTLARVWGRPPTEAEVAPYWRDVIERNRDRLADRDNADLIFPGQSFALPDVPAAP